MNDGKDKESIAPDSVVRLRKVRLGLRRADALGIWGVDELTVDEMTCYL